MKSHLKAIAIAAAASVGTIAATPASAVELTGHASEGAVFAQPLAETLNHGKDRGRHEGWYRGKGHDRYATRYNDRRYYGDRVTYNTRVWRGRDNRYYCRKENGTTGLLIGAAVGGVIGNEVAGYGDKSLGTLLGAVGGALVGREIDRSDASCR